MRNLGCGIFGVLAVSVRNPGGAQVIPFKSALLCVRPPVDLTNMMAQYQSHSSNTIVYMQDYLDQFHKLIDICFEFRVTKCTQAEVDTQRNKI